MKASSRSRAIVEPHLVGVAPAKSSSQRGQPLVFLPKTTPPQVCLVVFDLVHAILLLRSVYLVGVVRPQTNINTKKHVVLNIYNYFLGVFPSFDKYFVFCVILIQFWDG
jgi:hypothetical protein